MPMQTCASHHLRSIQQVKFTCKIEGVVVSKRVTVSEREQGRKNEFETDERERGEEGRESRRAERHTQRQDPYPLRLQAADTAALARKTCTPEHNAVLRLGDLKLSFLGTLRMMQTQIYKMDLLPLIVNIQGMLVKIVLLRTKIHFILRRTSFFVSGREHCGTEVSLPGCMLVGAPEHVRVHMCTLNAPETPEKFCNFWIPCSYKG